jgi:RNA polymerase sigma-70 factor (ECF subfamily)
MDKYLFKSVKYQLFNHYRNGKINREILQDKFEEFIEENNESVDHELIDNLEKALNNLPEKRCQIIKMNKMQDMSIEEIAACLNISKQTVKNQLTVGVKQLRVGIL